MVPRALFRDLVADVAKPAAVGQIPEPALAAVLVSSARGATGALRCFDDEEPGPGLGAGPGAVCDLALLEAAEERVRKAAPTLAVRDLTSVVLAYSLAQAGSKELYAVLQRACMEKCRQFPLEQVASLLWSFATVRLGPTFFREVQFDIVDRLSQLTAPASCDILWAYCAARHRDLHFFQAILSVLTPSAISGDRRCALLCPALLDIRTHLPEMDPEGLDRYLGYARGEFHRQQLLAAAPEAALEGLSSALRKLGVPHERLADVDGYVVDVLVHDVSGLGVGPPAECRPVSVLYHSPGRTLHRRTGEPLGQAIMRQRHLEGRGYGVLNLLDSTWDSLDAAARASLLRKRLQQVARRPEGQRET